MKKYRKVTVVVPRGDGGQSAMVFENAAYRVGNAGDLHIATTAKEQVSETGLYIPERDAEASIVFAPSTWMTVRIDS